MRNRNGDSLVSIINLKVITDLTRCLYHQHVILFSVHNNSGKKMDEVSKYICVCPILTSSSIRSQKLFRRGEDISRLFEHKIANDSVNGEHTCIRSKKLRRIWYSLNILYGRRRECHNKITQPIPSTQRKRKPLSSKTEIIDLLQLTYK